MPARLCAAVTIASASLAASGGHSSAPIEGASPATTAPTTTAAPKNPRPEELQGTWFLSTAAADPVRLYLRESSYLVSRGGSHSGDVEAEGDILTFTSICGGSNVEGTGRYRWALKEDTLHFDLIGTDECGGRSAVLEDATYERRG